MTKTPISWMLNAHLAGLNVMPLRERSKEPLLPSWRDLMWNPADTATVHRWSRLYPTANYAVICGMASGFVVIDTDTKEASYEVEGWAKWTFVVATGKGTHYYAKHPLQGEIGNRIGAKPGVDLRGDGGYVVGPGSIHPSGHEYALISLLGWGGLGCNCPQFNVKWLPAVKKVDTGDGEQPDKSSRSMDDAEFHDKLLALNQSTRDFLVGEYWEGPNWNQRIYNAACDMAGNGWPFGWALKFLVGGAHPLTEDDRDQAENTIRSAFSRPRLSGREYVTRKNAQERKTA